MIWLKLFSSVRNDGLLTPTRALIGGRQQNDSRGLSRALRPRSPGDADCPGHPPRRCRRPGGSGCPRTYRTWSLRRTKRRGFLIGLSVGSRTPACPRRHPARKMPRGSSSKIGVTSGTSRQKTPHLCRSDPPTHKPDTVGREHGLDLGTDTVGGQYSYGHGRGSLLESLAVLRVEPTSVVIDTGSRTRPTNVGARTVIAGHAFVQNLRRGHYELAVDQPVQRRVVVAFRRARDDHLRARDTTDCASAL